MNSMRPDGAITPCESAYAINAYSKGRSSRGKMAFHNQAVGDFGAHACQRLRNFITAITRFLDGLFLFHAKQLPVNLIQQIAFHALELGQEFPGLRSDLRQLLGSKNYQREK